jgi:hypothetical protein
MIKNLTLFIKFYSYLILNLNIVLLYFNRANQILNILNYSKNFIFYSLDNFTKKQMSIYYFYYFNYHLY